MNLDNDELKATNPSIVQKFENAINKIKEEINLCEDDFCTGYRSGLQVALDIIRKETKDE